MNTLQLCIISASFVHRVSEILRVCVCVCVLSLSWECTRTLSYSSVWSSFMSESLVLLHFARGSRGSGPFLLQGQQFSSISFSFLTASVSFITSFYGWGISKGARLMRTCCEGCNLNLLNFFGLFLLWDIDLGSTVLCPFWSQCSYSVNMRRLTVTKIIPCHIVPQFRIASMPTEVHANLIVLNCSQRTRPPKRKDMPKTSSTFESTEPHAVSHDSISLVTWANGRGPWCQHTEPWY